MLDEKELELLEDWRFRNRMPSRSAAVRELLRRGLVATDVTPASESTHTGAFAVLPNEADED
jgi:hypothetical protein